MPVEHVDDGEGGSRPCPAATQRLVGVPQAVTTHRLWSALGMIARALRWGYAGGLIAHKYAPLTHPRPLSMVECAVRVALLGAAGAWLASPRHCRPWRAALLAVLLLFAEEVSQRIVGLRQRVAHARYMPPHLRASPDEPAIVARCGGGSDARARLARWATLAALHAGPMLWLSLCFQIGELASKLSAPLTEPRRLWLLGRGLDFSFGTDEMPPPKLLRAVAFSQRVRDGLTAAVAIALELLLSGAVSVGARGGVVYDG